MDFMFLTSPSLQFLQLCTNVIEDTFTWRVTVISLFENYVSEIYADAVIAYFFFYYAKSDGKCNSRTPQFCARTLETLHPKFSKTGDRHNEFRMRNRECAFTLRYFSR